MATFLITGPDGKKYKVTGDNPEGAMAALRTTLGAAPAEQPITPSNNVATPAPQGMPTGAMAELSALSTPGNGAPMDQAGIDLARQWKNFDSANPEVPAWAKLDRSQPPPQAGKYMYGTQKGEVFVPQDPRLSGGRAFADALSNGLTLGWGDEIQAAVRAPFSDKTYGDIQGELQGRKELGKEIYPDASAAGNVTGGIAAPSLGVGKLIAAAPGVLGKTAMGALGGGGLGAIFGAGDAAAGERVEGAGYGALAGALSGGALTALTAGGSKILDALMQRGANKEFIANTPTTDTLMDDASTLYNQGRTTGATASPAETTKLFDDIMATGRAEAAITPAGRVTNEMSSLNSVFRLLKDYKGKPMTPVEMQSVRAALTDALQSATGNEARIARKMLEQFDGFVAPLVPEFAEGAAKYSLAKGGESVDELAKLAESRAGQYSNSGMENSIRTEARALDRKLIKGQERGYTPDEIALVEAMAKAPPKVIEQINKFAPNGLIPIMAAGGAGSMLGGPAGMAVAGGLAGAGALTRKVLTDNQTGRLALLNALRRTAEGVAPKGAKVDQGLLNMIRDALMKGATTGATSNAP